MKKIILVALIFTMLLGIVACDSEKIDPSPLEYTLSEDKQSYTVSGFGSFTGTNLIIPDFYCGLPVTEIEDYAFSDCSALTSLTIGANIKNIGYNAFDNCDNLKELKYNAVSCNDVKSSPFNNLGYDLMTGTTVTIGSQVEKIPAYMFGAGDFDLIALNIGALIFEDGSKCKTIGDYAFSRFLNGAFLSLPESLETIGEKAFYSSEIIQVTLPGSLKHIGFEAFYSCSKLVEIYNLSTIDLQLGYKENGYVAHNAIAIHSSLSESSILDTVGDFIFVPENGTHYIIAYTGESKDISLPSDYKNSSYGIYKFAFYATGINSVTIPEKVNYIGLWAFESCTDLKNVVFEDPHGWGYLNYNRYEISAEALKDSVNAAELLGGGTFNIINYATSTWTKEP